MATRASRLRARDFFDQLARAADIPDGHLPKEFLRFEVSKTYLLCDESYCSRCFNAGAERLTGIAIQSAGKIDRQHRHARLFHGVDNRREWIARRLIQPGAENRVDDQYGASRRNRMKIDRLG